MEKNLCDCFWYKAVVVMKAGIWIPFISFATIALNATVMGHRGEEPGTGELVQVVLDFTCVVLVE